MQPFIVTEDMVLWGQYIGPDLSRFEGSVEISDYLGRVDFGPCLQVSGSLSCGEGNTLIAGDIFVGGNLQVCNSLFARRHLDVQGNAEVGHNIRAQIHLSVEGHLKAGGRVTVGRDLRVLGCLDALETWVGRRILVRGDLDSARSVTAGLGLVVDGSLSTSVARAEFIKVQKGIFVEELRGLLRYGVLCCGKHILPESAQKSVSFADFERTTDVQEAVFAAA